MSDVYSTIFSDDPRTGALTYDQLQARRKIALALATRNRPYPKTIGEGLTALGEGLGEGFANDRLARQEAVQAEEDRRSLLPPSGAATPLPPTVAPAVPRAPVVPRATPGRSAEDTGNMVAQAPDDTDPLAYVHERQPPRISFNAIKNATSGSEPLTAAQARQQPQIPIDEWMLRIARNESGGSRDPYSLVGERSRRGDYPYGRYQVMGENIPVWTKKYLGREMTPEEFLANPQAQDQVARARGSEYVAKYGPVGAAAAWFAGEKGMNDQSRKDTLGTSVAEYQRRFSRPLVSRNQVATAAAKEPVDAENASPYQVASLGDGVQMRETATPDVGRDNIAQALVGPQPQRVADAAPPIPQPSPPPPDTFGPQVSQGGPRVPAFPAYDRTEPQPPQPTPDMIHYRRVAADPYRSEQTRATAMQIYTEMKAAQDAEFARKYQLWHENRTKERDYNIALPKAQEDLTNAYLQRLKTPQSIVQQPYGPQPGQQSQTQAQLGGGPDPRLGTPQSPQRTGIPTVPPVPPGIIPEKWAELQATEQKDAVAAVQKAVPQFEDAIKTIRLAREHPGMEYGLGLGGIIGRQTPGTNAFAFGKVNEQLQGKTFLQGYATLRGGGQISNVEGEKTQAAQARLDPRQDKASYIAALDDLEIQMRRDLETAQRKVNAPVTAWRAPGDNSSFAPDIGQQRDAKSGGREEYIGGNPAWASSWKKL